MRVSLLAVAVLSGLLGSRAWAVSPIPPRDAEELLLAETAYPQEDGELQVSLGMHGERTNTWDAMGLLLLTEYGLTDRLQVEVLAPLRWTAPGKVSEPGPGLETELRYALFASTELGLVVSPGLEVEFPLSLSRTGAPPWGISPSVAAAQQLGRVFLHLNVTLELQAPRGAQRELELELEPTATFAATLPVGRFVPMVELGTSWLETETRTWLSPGVVWRPMHGIELAVGLPTRLTTRGVTEVRPTLLLTGEFELADDDADQAP